MLLLFHCKNFTPILVAAERPLISAALNAVFYAIVMIRRIA